MLFSPTKDGIPNLIGFIMEHMHPSTWDLVRSCIRTRCNPPKWNPGSSRKPFSRACAHVLRTHGGANPGSDPRGCALTDL